MWMLYAIFAAAVWGLDYAVGERVLRGKVSPVSLLAIQMAVGAIVFAILGSCFSLKQDMRVILGDRRLLWLTIAAILSFSLGNLLIFLSIEAKNATLAGIVELCYPIFIVLFTYVLFKENQLNFGVVVGGLLVMLGAGVLSYYA
jgi:uncharacterized membrane protein